MTPRSKLAEWGIVVLVGLTFLLIAAGGAALAILATDWLNRGVPGMFYR